MPFWWRFFLPPPSPLTGPKGGGVLDSPIIYMFKRIRTMTNPNRKIEARYQKNQLYMKLQRSKMV